MLKHIHAGIAVVLSSAVAISLLVSIAGCGGNNKQRSNAIRRAFVMSVHPGQEAEYERRHRPIWPELENTLKNHGVTSYSIFLDRDTDRLFAYVEFESQAQWDVVSQTEVCKRWWAHMKDIMPSNPDNSPVSKELKEVFHIEK